MVWAKEVRIHCDEDGCSEEIVFDYEDSIAEAERRSFEYGWAEEKGEHYCPHHNNE
jgi:hypothetical protein